MKLWCVRACVHACVLSVSLRVHAAGLGRVVSVYQDISSP